MGDEVEVTERLEKVDPVGLSEQLVHRTADLRVRMHRIDDGDVRMARGDGA